VKAYFVLLELSNNGSGHSGDGKDEERTMTFTLSDEGRSSWSLYISAIVSA